jgi:hypothetical protein
VNLLARSLGGGSHSLGEFFGVGNANGSNSDGWGDEEKLTDAALQVVSGRLGVEFPRAKCGLIMALKTLRLVPAIRLEQ